MEKCIGIVDCREDSNLQNDFLSLNLAGRPVFSFITESLLSCKRISKVILVTDSLLIRTRAEELFGERIQIANALKVVEPSFIASGRAPFLQPDTIDSAIEKSDGRVMTSYIAKRKISDYFDPSFLGSSTYEVRTNAFVITDGGPEESEKFVLSAEQGLVINTRWDFELALLIRRKQINKELITRNILTRISEKKNIFRNGEPDGICLVGHSQMDFWKIGKIADKNVRNCGIAGINSYEYNEYILTKNLLNCTEKNYILMHGTNDIVCEHTLEENVKSIQNTIDYIINRQPQAKIFFIQCLHTNGRMDRSNRLIDEFNRLLRRNLRNIIWVDTATMDDDFANLKMNYTVDGLHLSDEGYKALQELVELKMAPNNV